MAQNLSYIRDTLLRRHLNDTGKITWGDSELNIYINDGNRYLISEMLKVNSEYNLVRATASCVAAQEEYFVPSNMYSNKFKGMWVYNSSSDIRQEVKYADSNKIQDMAHLSGLPRFYTVLRNIYILAPVPDSTYTLELWYTWLPSTQTQDTDPSSFNDEELDVIALWAAIRAKEARELQLGNLPNLLNTAVSLVKSNITPDDKLAVRYTPLDEPNS